MYILYLDESGTHGEASYFVLAGLAVFEREIYWYNQDLEALQTEYFPSETTPVFFHASRLNVREGDKVESPWDQLTGRQRGDLKQKVCQIISSRQGVLFGCAIERQYSNNRQEEPYERAFEDLLRRFDLYLSRLNAYAKARGKEEQRGMIVLAESSYQRAIKPVFPILGVFRLNGQSKRDDGMIFGSCKAIQSPVYPIWDAFLAVNHASCPSLSSSGPRQWGESALKTSRLPGALSPSWQNRGYTLPQLGAGDNRPIRSNTPWNNRRGTDTSDN